jgi:NHLM bacteriocin system ABC transporter peptidase/ATP-binding protein
MMFKRRVVAPTVMQIERTECGAACLGTVLAFYGRHVPLEELRVLCGVSRDGSKASNVAKAARHFGMIATGWRKDVDALRQTPGPYIIFWQFNHYVVVERFAKGWVYFSDPAKGRRRVTEAEFDRGYTGVMLEIRPGPTFTKGGKTNTWISAVQKRMEGRWSEVVMAVVAGIMLIVPNLMLAGFLQALIDDWNNGASTLPMTSWAIVLLLCGLLSVIGSHLQQIWLLRLGTRLSVQGSARFVWRMLRMPVSFFQQRSAGDLADRIQANNRVAEMLSGRLSNMMLSLVVALAYLVLMFVLDPSMALLTTALATLNVVLLYLVAQKRMQANRKLLADRGQLAGTTMAGLQAIETFKCSGSEDDFFQRWTGIHARLHGTERTLAGVQILLTVVPPLLGGINMTMLLGVGGHRVLDQEMTLGGLVQFQWLAMAFIRPMTELVGVTALAQDLQADMHRLDDLARNHEDPALQPNEARMQRVKLTGHIEFRSVSFSYSPLGTPLIKDFSLVIRPGQRIALVGPTGSGKSTLVRLLGGLYQPTSGQILFDGLERQAWPRTLLANSIGMVDQNIMMFEGTVRDNITLWDGSIDDASVEQAARDACIHDEIVARQGVYDARVEEGGRNFSGGQRQRLEIARTLARNPTLLVLDEATSALDAEVEQRIDARLRSRGCTCLIVAHRLSTIRDCDQILVFDRGEVVERGTHEELLALGGRYCDLVEH